VADSVFTVEDRDRLFDPGVSENNVWKDWDISRSGDRFLMILPYSSEARMILIQNFFTELEERAGS
jgi:hypothetical protein